MWRERLPAWNKGSHWLHLEQSNHQDKWWEQRTIVAWMKQKSKHPHGYKQEEEEGKMSLNKPRKTDGGRRGGMGGNLVADSCRRKRVSTGLESISHRLRVNYKGNPPRASARSRIPNVRGDSTGPRLRCAQNSTPCGWREAGRQTDNQSEKIPETTNETWMRTAD